MTRDALSDKTTLNYKRTYVNVSAAFLRCDSPPSRAHESVNRSGHRPSRALAAYIPSSAAAEAMPSFFRDPFLPTFAFSARAPPEEEADVAPLRDPALTKAFVALSRAVFSVAPRRKEKVPNEPNWPNSVGTLPPPKISV